jgi:hypothetical protein
MNRHLDSAPARHARRRGYSTLELVTAATLGALLISAVLAWAGGVARVVTAGVSAGDGGRTVLAVSRMRDDLLAAGHCDGSGRDAVVRNLTADRIDTVVLREDEPVLVSYRLQGGALQRAETSMPEDCATPDVTGWVDAASGFSPGIVFLAPVRDGTYSSGEGDYFACEDVFGEGCVLDAVRVQLQRESTEEIVAATLRIAS